MDIYSKEKRSELMSKVRSKDTKPEIIVRKFLHNSGYRFRLHNQKLPGKPDIILPKYRSVIFVNGCFWHNHKGCKKARLPESNAKFWKSKINANVERDKRNKKALIKLGWNVLNLWECEINNGKYEKKLISFLEGNKNA